MKLTLLTTRVNPSAETTEISSKNPLKTLINTVSKCALAVLTGLITVTTLMSGAAAYPYPRVAVELPPTTTTIAPDLVQTIPINEANHDYSQCLRRGIGNFRDICSSERPKSDFWPCTIL